MLPPPAQWKYGHPRPRSRRVGEVPTSQLCSQSLETPDLYLHLTLFTGQSDIPTWNMFFLIYAGMKMCWLKHWSFHKKLWCWNMWFPIHKWHWVTMTMLCLKAMRAARSRSILHTTNDEQNRTEQTTTIKTTVNNRYVQKLDMISPLANKKTFLLILFSLLMHSTLVHPFTASPGVSWVPQAKPPTKLRKRLLNKLTKGTGGEQPRYVENEPTVVGKNLQIVNRLWGDQ